jgi:hypothetical protein
MWVWNLVSSFKQETRTEGVRKQKAADVPNPELVRSSKTFYVRISIVVSPTNSPPSMVIRRQTITNIAFIRMLLLQISL